MRTPIAGALPLVAPAMPVRAWFEAFVKVSEPSSVMLTSLGVALLKRKGQAGRSGTMDLSTG